MIYTGITLNSDEICTILAVLNRAAEFAKKNGDTKMFNEYCTAYDNLKSERQAAQRREVFTHEK